jgi:hypothetical protein
VVSTVTTSSSSRLPLADRVRCVVAALAATALVAFPAQAFASPASQSTPVIVHRASEGRPTVVIPVGTGDGDERPELEVVDDTGAEVSWSAAPLVGAGSPFALVVGASAGADGGRIGAAAIDLLLRLSPGVRTYVVAGGDEPTVVARPDDGVGAAAREVALLGEASGNTAAAVQLAVRSLQQERRWPRALVVYPDAASQQVAAQDLAAAIKAADAVPLVVEAGAQQAYWQAVVDAAGGQLVTPGSDDAAAGAVVARSLAALQAVTLQPEATTRTVHLRIAGAPEGWTAQVVPSGAVETAGEPPPSGRTTVIMLVALGVLALATVALAVVFSRRRRRNHHHRHLAAGRGTRSPARQAWAFWRRGGPSAASRRSHAAHRD